MTKIGATIPIALVTIIILAITIYLVRTMSYSDPHQTRIYCFENSSRESDTLRDILSDLARYNNMTIYDRSDELARDLVRLGRPKPSKVLHGVMQRDNDVVMSYSNVGSNENVFHISFYSKGYESISSVLDQAIQRSTSPLQAKVIPGGSFDDSFCVE